MERRLLKGWRGLDRDRLIPLGRRKALVATLTYEHHERLVNVLGPPIPKERFERPPPPKDPFGGGDPPLRAPGGADPFGGPDDPFAPQPGGGENPFE